MFKGQHHESRKSLSLLLTLEHAYCTKKSQLLRGTFCFAQVQGPNALTTLLHLADELLHPYKFYGRDMSGILIFIFASCEPLDLPSLRKLKLALHQGL